MLMYLAYLPEPMLHKTTMYIFCHSLPCTKRNQPGC